MKKTLLFSMAIMSFAYAEIPAADFAKYPTPLQNITCKELDFTSYHKAQSVKGNILRANPERIHPNFAGKYLLLRNDYLFDTAWFVADCTTGKFIHETLSTDHLGPKTEFNASSALVAVTGTDPKNQAPLQYHVFQNEKWMQVESAPAVASPAASAAAASTPSPDEPTFQEFSAPLKDTCKEPDFNSNARAQSSKKSLMASTPDRTHPNFGGHFLLLKGETIFQTYWLLANCETGKIYPEFLTGSAHFEKDSRLFKVYSSGKFPTYYAWSETETQWIRLRGENIVSGKTAKRIFDSLPNRDHSNTIHFENLQCAKALCTVDFPRQKATPTLGTPSDLNPVLNEWGTHSIIKSGKCKSDNGKYTCEIEN